MDPSSPWDRWKLRLSRETFVRQYGLESNRETLARLARAAAEESEEEGSEK